MHQIILANSLLSARVADEGLINLNGIGGKSSEIVTTRIACAKSIKRQMDAEFPDATQTFHFAFVIGD